MAFCRPQLSMVFPELWYPRNSFQGSLYPFASIKVVQNDLAPLSGAKAKRCLGAFWLFLPC